ncbi:MAG: hypothetical protein ACM3L6_01755 [Deltaproteobacteria bacterium]
MVRLATSLFCHPDMKWSLTDLTRAFALLYNSLGTFNERFTLHCYTNLPIKGALENVDFIPWDFDLFPRRLENPFTNMSYGKIFLVKELGYPAWIDLDTVVTSDLGNLAPFPRFVLSRTINGVLHKTVRRCNYLNSPVMASLPQYYQGHFWRIDEEDLRLIEELFPLYKDQLVYNVQDMFAIINEKERPGHFPRLHELVPDHDYGWWWLGNSHPRYENVGPKLRFRKKGFFSDDGTKLGIMAMTNYFMRKAFRTRWVFLHDDAARKKLCAMTYSVPEALAPLTDPGKNPIRRIAMPKKTAEKACKTCGKKVAGSGHLCVPVSGKGSVCDWCGSLIVDERHMCDPRIKRQTYICNSCGRTAVRAALLCKPKKIKG